MWKDLLPQIQIELKEICPDSERIPYDCKKNQMTVADKRWSGQTLKITDPNSSSSNVQISGNGNEWYRYYHYDNGYIVNQRGLVLEV